MRVTAIVLLAAVLPACDRAADDAAKSAKAAGAQAAARDPLADMVSAVSGAKTAEPVELKFALRSRPAVGEPIEIEIAVLPVSPLERVAAHFQAGAGLVLRNGREMTTVTKPTPGVPLAHRVTVVPERDGIFFVTATVLADSTQQSLSRTFSIPIIAGQAAPPPPPPPEADTPGATAQSGPQPDR